MTWVLEFKFAAHSGRHSLLAYMVNPFNHCILAYPPLQLSLDCPCFSFDSWRLASQGLAQSTNPFITILRLSILALHRPLNCDFMEPTDSCSSG